MAAHSADLSETERKIIARVVTAFQEGVPNATLEWVPHVDSSRNNAFIVLTTEVPPALGNMTFTQAAMEVVQNADEGVHGVYINYCPLGRTFTYVIDIARPGIEVDDLKPFDTLADATPLPPNAERKRKFENENASKTHSKSQLSLAYALGELWLGGCAKLLGDVDVERCEVPGVEVTRFKKESSQATAMVQGSLAVATQMSWGTHSVAEIRKVSRHVRRVDLHLEIRPEDVFVTVRMTIDTPDARRNADWIKAAHDKNGNRIGIRNIQFVTQTEDIRVATSTAQHNARAEQKRQARNRFESFQNY